MHISGRINFKCIWNNVLVLFLKFLFEINGIVFSDADKNSLQVGTAHAQWLCKPSTSYLHLTSFPKISIFVTIYSSLSKMHLFHIVVCVTRTASSPANRVDVGLDLFNRSVFSVALKHWKRLPRLPESEWKTTVYLLLIALISYSRFGSRVPFPPPGSPWRKLYRICKRIEGVRKQDP